MSRREEQAYSGYLECLKLPLKVGKLLDIMNLCCTSEKYTDTDIGTFTFTYCTPIASNNPLVVVAEDLVSDKIEQ